MGSSNETEKLILGWTNQGVRSIGNSGSGEGEIAIQALVRPLPMVVGEDVTLLSLMLDSGVTLGYGLVQLSGDI